jgi:hypothetical protein
MLKIIETIHHKDISDINADVVKIPIYFDTDRDIFVAKLPDDDEITCSSFQRLKEEVNDHMNKKVTVSDIEKMFDILYKESPKYSEFFAEMVASLCTLQERYNDEDVETNDFFIRHKNDLMW